MKVYNTMTRQKEELVPLTEGEVSIYCCGPTVYNYIHVGNARPMILFDVLPCYDHHPFLDCQVTDLWVERRYRF